MTNSIVTVNVTQTIAPTPNTLQKKGAFITQGGTSGAANTLTLLTALADLTAIKRIAKAITSIAWAGNIATVTTAAPHGLTNGDVIPVTIAGATPAGYNGSVNATVTGASTFTYPLTPNPGAETVPGTYILQSVAELTAMATTFFAQGAQQSVYVLELGPGEPADGVTDLAAYITANPSQLYSYLVPRLWAPDAAYLAFLADFEATTSKTYFFTTVTLGNYTDYTDLMKCVVAMVEAPATPATEFSLAAAFWVSLHYDPSSTNRVTPYAFSYLFGVTPYPLEGNGAILQTLKTAAVNVVGTGAEGGISNAILLWGTTMDGRDFTYWYSVDWVQINCAISIANAIINGSNNPINPLYYNQDGINRLQSVVAGTMASAIAFGLALGTVVQTAYTGAQFTAALENGDFDAAVAVNAVPFIPYSAENPSDYRIGKYAGLSVSYLPARGFIEIVFNINVTDFVTS